MEYAAALSDCKTLSVWSLTDCTCKQIVLLDQEGGVLCSGIRTRPLRADCRGCGAAKGRYNRDDLVYVLCCYDALSGCCSLV